MLFLEPMVELIQVQSELAPPVGPKLLLEATRALTSNDSSWKVQQDPRLTEN
jgi:hypothetical protein